MTNMPFGKLKLSDLCPKFPEGDSLAKIPIEFESDNR